MLNVAVKYFGTDTLKLNRRKNVRLPRIIGI